MTKTVSAKRVYLFALHLLLVYLAAMVVADRWRRADDAPAHVRAMIGYFDRMDASIPARSIIFLGDSLTQSLAVTAVAPSSVNLGIGHLTCDQLLEALPRFRSLSRASAIVVSIGLNDILHQPGSDLEANLERLARALPVNTPLVWSAITPIANGAPDTIAAIRRANSRIQALCASRPGCVFVDTWEFSTDSSGAVRPEMFNADGIHLGDAGYRSWIVKLRGALGSSAP